MQKLEISNKACQHINQTYYNNYKKILQSYFQ